jgi:hypothetical protein
LIRRIAEISASEPDERQPPRLRQPDAVLGRDAAPEGGDEPEHGVVDRVVAGRRADDVDVQVAVGEVTEEKGAVRRVDGRSR